MRKWIVVGFVAAAFCSVLLSIASAATSEEMERRALAAMGAGDYTRAVTIWQEILERNPGLPRALYNLACCYSRTGELELAAARLEEAYQSGMSDPELVQTDPDLEALRTTRKGRALINRLASEAAQRRRLRGEPESFKAPVLGGMRVVLPREIEPGKKYPLVMILHGHGANPENYVGIFEHVASSLEAIVCAPYGPYPIPFERGHGYSWYPAPWFFRELLQAGPSPDDPAQRRREIEIREKAVSQGFVLAAVDHVSRDYPVDPGRVFLLGHSEGGVLAYGLALEHPDQFRGLIVVGSRLRESDATPETLEAAAGRLEVMICHSREDRAISFDHAKAAAATLKDSGIENKIYAYPGGHGLTNELITSIGRWIAARSRD